MDMYRAAFLSRAVATSCKIPQISCDRFATPVSESLDQNFIFWDQSLAKLQKERMVKLPPDCHRNGAKNTRLPKMPGAGFVLLTP
jgi:hypothetical protein